MLVRCTKFYSHFSTLQNRFLNPVSVKICTLTFSDLLDLQAEVNLRAAMWLIIHLSTYRHKFLLEVVSVPLSQLGIWFAFDHILHWLFHAITAFLPLTGILLVSSDRGYWWGWGTRGHCHSSWLPPSQWITCFSRQWTRRCAIPTASLPNSTSLDVQKPTGLFGIQIRLSWVSPLASVSRLIETRWSLALIFFTIGRWSFVIQFDVSTFTPTKLKMLHELIIEGWSSFHLHPLKYDLGHLVCDS